MTTNKTRYSYELDFQEHILASFVSDEQFLIKHMDIIHPEFFDDEILAGICNAVVEFFTVNKKLPDEVSLNHEIKTHMMPGRKYNEYKDCIRSVYKKIGVNVSYYRQHAIEFAKKQSIMDAVRKSRDLVEEGEYDQVQELITKAVQTGARYSDITYDYFAKYYSRAESYVAKRKGTTTRLTTGISELDKLTQGGLDKGELGIVVAPPKSGKSTTLFNFGAVGVMAGSSVLHVTLEMRRSMVAMRYDSRFVGYSMVELQKKPNGFVKAMKKLRNSMNGRLHIVEYPTKTLTMSSLKSIASGIKGLGLIIVDYADLMRPPRYQKDRRLELIETYEQLRGVAGELQVPIWTASQANRSAVGAKIVSMDMVAEAFDKIAIADLALTVCMTPVEAHSGRMRLFTAANRLGVSGEQIECSVNWKTATIRSVDVGDLE